MFTLLLAIACSEPPPPPAEPAAGQPAPAEGAPAPGVPAAGGPPAPGDATMQPPPAAPGEFPVGDAAMKPGAPPPGLAALVGTGASAKLTVTVQGAPSAMIDFVIEGPDGTPQTIAQEKLDSATATLTVPASYDKPVWLAAFNDQGQTGPDPSDAIGFYPSAIRFEGKDQSVTIKLESGSPPPLVGPFGKPPKDGQPPGVNPPPGAPGGAPPAGAAPGALPGAPGTPPAGTAPAAPTPGK